MSSAEPPSRLPALVWLRPEPPARRTLGRDAIVEAGIRVADSRGAEALTMAAVAAELGSFTAMALYRYVGSKDGLVDLMLDRVVGEVALPDPAGRDWRAACRRLALDSWAMAQRHPWYPELVHTRPPLGPNTLRRTEATLTVLHAAGLGVTEALGYVAMLDRHVFSAVVSGAQERAMAKAYGIDGPEGLAGAVTALRRVVAGQGEYPLLAGWMSAPDGLSAEDQMTAGLDFLLDGIARRVLAAGQP